jgi:hypothetical protein
MRAFVVVSVEWFRQALDMSFGHRYGHLAIHLDTKSSAAYV